MVDLSVVLKAGLTQVEVADVLGVSRVTLNMWVRGKMRPHRLHVKDVEARLALLRRAVEQNLIPKKMRGKSRSDAIAVAIEQASIRPMGDTRSET